MEEVLDIYEAPHSADEPLICMDEAAKQLLRDELPPRPMRPAQPRRPDEPPRRGRPLREDYHYERRGVQAIFLFFDPLRGWRRVSTRESRTRVDWAEEVRILLEEDYPHARKITLVCDNLNTHHIASLYAAFAPDHARRLARRLEIRHTPRNGSWLNVAEIELSVLARQCTSRRIGSAAELAAELDAWSAARNRAASTVRWRFTTDQARNVLRNLYPSI